MEKRDILTRLAGLEIKAGEQKYREFQMWLAEASEPERLEWADDVAHFATAMGFPLERIGKAESSVEEKQEEALAYYAMALWRAYELETLRQANELQAASRSAGS